MCHWWVAGLAVSCEQATSGAESASPSECAATACRRHPPSDWSCAVCIPDPWTTSSLGAGTVLPWRASRPWTKNEKPTKLRSGFMEYLNERVNKLNLNPTSFYDINTIMYVNVWLTFEESSLHTGFLSWGRKSPFISFIGRYTVRLWLTGARVILKLNYFLNLITKTRLENVKHFEVRWTK